MPANLQRILAAAKGRHVAVIGDSMLDVYLWGDASRISPEAPVPVVLLERQTFALGGAANVAANVAALGGRPVLLSGAGEDGPGARLQQLITNAGLEGEPLLRLAGRPTTVKHRVLARNKHLLRLDLESTVPWPAAAIRLLLSRLRKEAPSLNALVLSDYAKGCVTSVLAQGVAAICREHGIPWCVDPKTSGLRFSGATVLKPNQHELQLLSGLPVRSEVEIRAAADRLFRRHRCGHVLVTRGAMGMGLLTDDGTQRWFPSRGRAVADVTGAGDTVLAALGLGLGARVSVAEAAELANCAAGIVVTRPGTAVATPADLLEAGRS